MTTDFVTLDELLFKVHTEDDYYYAHTYEKALDFYEKHNGIVILGYTTNIFPKWYVIKDRKRTRKKWFIEVDSDKIKKEVHL